MTSSEFPSTIIFPLSIANTCSAYCNAISSLCSTIKNVIFCFLQIFEIFLNISCAKVGFTPAIGSSIRIILASDIIARPNSRSFCCPPLRFLLRVSLCSTRFTISIISSAFSVIFFSSFFHFDFSGAKRNDSPVLLLLEIKKFSIVVRFVNGCGICHVLTRPVL